LSIKVTRRKEIEMNIKKWHTLVLSCFFIFGAIDNLSAIELKSSPVNSNEKIDFILKTLELNKEYKPNENVEIFKRILVGNWDGPPHGSFKFLQDGSFEAENEENIKISGLWLIEGNDIVLKNKNGNLLDRKEITYYTLYQSKRRPNRYEMIVMFNNRNLKILLHMSDALVIRIEGQ